MIQKKGARKKSSPAKYHTNIFVALGLAGSIGVGLLGIGISQPNVDYPTSLVATPRPAQLKVTATSLPVVATSTPSEAQTPLQLTDPTATDTTISSQPWWQSALDVLWKLALVLGLIYGSMRLLALLKENGGTGKGFFSALKPQTTGHTNPFQLLESLEEIRLSPHHTLHAVRVANRVVLLARSGTTLTVIGESQLGEESSHEVSPTAIASPASFPVSNGEEKSVTNSHAPSSFRQQLLSAWSNILPTTTHASTDEPMISEADVFDGQWVTVEPDVTPIPSSTSSPASQLPVRKGIARPSDRSDTPEPLDDSTVREIIFFAEEHGVAATAKKYGLTNQRVTSIRARYEKARAKRLQQQTRGHADSLSMDTGDDDKPNIPTPKTPPPASAKASGITQPFVVKRQPRQEQPANPAPVTRSRSAITSAYGQAATSAGKPATPPDVTGETTFDDQASTIAQALATRFNIRFDASPRRK